MKHRGPIIPSIAEGDANRIGHQVKCLLRKGYKEEEWILKTDVPEDNLPTKGKLHEFWNTEGSTDYKLQRESVEKYLKRVMSTAIINRFIICDEGNQVIARGEKLDLLFNKEPLEEIIECRQEPIWKSNHPIAHDIEAMIPVTIQKMALEYQGWRKSNRLGLQNMADAWSHMPGKISYM